MHVVMLVDQHVVQRYLQIVLIKTICHLAYHSFYHSIYWYNVSKSKSVIVSKDNQVVLNIEYSD